MKERTNLLYRIETLLSEGVLAACVLLFLSILGFFVYVKLEELKDFSALLPAEDTLVYVTADARDYLKSADELPAESPVDLESISNWMELLIQLPMEEMTWFKGDLAFAWIDDQPVAIFKTRSVEETLTSYKSLLQGEETLMADAQYGMPVHSFSAHALHLAFFGNTVVVSQKIEPIALMIAAKKGELESLKQSADYQNVRSRLPITSSTFFYVNLPKSKLVLTQLLAKTGAFEPAFLQPLLAAFPAFGGTVHMESDGWYMETFLAVDKTLLDNKGLMRLEDKYLQAFLPASSESMAVEWGGANLYGKTQQLLDLLKQTGPTSSLLLESVIRSSAQDLFGERLNLEEELYPLLDQEFWLGLTPGFAFMIQLEPGESSQAYKLKDLFVQNFELKEKQDRTVAMLDGTPITEVQAELFPVTQEEKNHEGTPYFELRAHDAPLLYVSILEDAVIVASEEDQFFLMLDRFQGRVEPRALNQIGVLLPGSEEIIILNVDSLPVDNPLREVLSGFTSFSSTRKIFDDGIFTRHSLLFK